MFKQEGAPINVVIADHDSEWMMEVSQELSLHPRIKVIGFANTGRQAIERTVSMAADAVLMEYAMPDITAVEVMKQIAEDSPGTAVFAVSSSITAQLVQAVRSAGVSEVFDKTTFSPSEAAEKIATTVESLRREWAEAAKKHGVVGKGTGPKGEKVITEYKTRAITQSIILTYNTKGGVGKSTIAANLAVAIKMSPYFSGQRVALVDFDCGSANVATICGIPDMEAYNRNLASWEYVPDDVGAKEVEDLLIPGPKGIMIAAAPLNQAIAERIDHQLADKILRILRRHFGIIIIDGAPNIAPPIDAAFTHATHILLIANPEGQSVKQLARTVQLLRPDPEYPEKADMSHVLKKMFVVLNHAQAGTRWDLKSSDIAGTIGRPIIADIPYDEAVKEALHCYSGKQAVELEGPFSTSIKSLADSLVGAYPSGAGAAAVSGGRKTGLLGLFKRR